MEDQPIQNTPGSVYTNLLKKPTQMPGPDLLFLFRSLNTNFP